MGLQKGNRKIGESVWTFSLPAVDCCPGATATCVKHCYARRGNFARPAVRRGHWRNAAERALPNWAQAVIFEIKRSKPLTFRVHASGDFDSARYARQWVKIAAACPATTFYAYTRSWRNASVTFALALESLASLPNFFLTLSCDKDSGRPPDYEGAKVAYLSTGPDDWPPYRVDLVFRTGRREPVKYSPNGELVCPTEQGGGLDLTCDQCRLCFSDRPIPNRIPLPMAV